MQLAKDSKDVEGAQYCFKTEPLTIPKGDTSGLRKFEGVAYSGEPIVDHWYWERVIFDLSSIQMKDRIPALLDHRASQRTGAVTNYAVSNEKGLEVSGTLLTNEFGTSVAKDSDDGFPWQMSVRILPERVEDIQAGTTVNVNGKDYSGPITIFRGGRIREVSFCALGADDNTSAEAMSFKHKPATFQQNPQENDMDLAQLTAKNTALEAEKLALTQQVTAFSTELEGVKSKARLDQIERLFKDVNREFKADDADVKAFAAMPQESFDVTSKMLREQFKAQPSAKPNLPSNLFNHQANGGTETPSNSLDDRFNNCISSLGAK